VRVAFLNPSSQLGGAERILLDILASLRASRPEWEPHLVATSDGPLIDKARDLGVPTTVVPLPDVVARLGDAGMRGPAGDRVTRRELSRRILSAGPAVGLYIARLSRALRALHPQVIHTNGFKMHMLGLWAAPRGVPVVWHIHDYVGRRPVMSRLLRLHASRCSTAIANSLSVAEDLRRVCGPRLIVAPVYNAIDLAVFHPEGPALDLDAAAGLPPAPAGTVRVALLGTLGRWKGHAVFLEALSLLPRGLPVRGYIVGGALYETDGSQYGLKELKLLTTSLGLDGRVGFTGFVSEPASAMRAVDIVVHASTQAEPFGLVIVEAMACGRAVIASEAGGSAELFTAGYDALGHPPGDVHALAQRIRTLVEDEEMRRSLGEQGRATAERRFDRDRLAGQLVPIYRRVSSGQS
jgi:glycosyltransferase involved in cell wall biosynthesis